MLGQFQGRLKEDRQRLAEAVDAGDSDRVRKLAHALKGASGNLAATVLSGQAAALETLTKDTSTAAPRECWQQLESEMERCLNQIEQLLRAADDSAANH
jgi:two-component system, sensor histidine kinase and response regulator